MNYLMLSTNLLILFGSTFGADWCDRSKFDLNGPYNDCLSITNKQDRQKCIAAVAFGNVIFPNSYHIISGNDIVPYFTSDIIGRITPTGIFPDYQQNVDYLYGIASSSSLLLGCETPGVVPFAATPHYLTSVDDIVSVRYDYTMGNYPINDCTMNFTLSGFMRFNDDGTQIKSYDFTLQRWGLAVAQINKCRGGQDRELGIEFICAVERQKCTKNTSQQYDHSHSDFNNLLTDIVKTGDFNVLNIAKDIIRNIKDDEPENAVEGLPSCRKFLRGLDKGTWDHVITNTVTCRVLHSFLAIVHPDIHCKHIGITGGMACKDYDYDFYYNQIY